MYVIMTSKGWRPLLPEMQGSDCDMGGYWGIPLSGIERIYPKAHAVGNPTYKELEARWVRSGLSSWGGGDS